MKKITALLLVVCLLFCLIACKNTAKRSNGYDYDSDYDYDDNEDDDSVETTTTYILNKNSKKIHYKGCISERKMLDKNRKKYTGDIEDLLDDGYTTCKNCFD